eukprot:jgi/Chlat1/2522/Chrsp175S08717
MEARAQRALAAARAIVLPPIASAGTGSGSTSPPSNIINNASTTMTNPNGAGSVAASSLMRVGGEDTREDESGLVRSSMPEVVANARWMRRLPVGVRQTVCACFTPQDAVAGEVLVRAGGRSGCMYTIESGTFVATRPAASVMTTPRTAHESSSSGPSSPTSPESPTSVLLREGGGESVSGAVTLSTLGPGDFFGELSLLHGCAHAATVEATYGGGRVWALSLEDFTLHGAAAAFRQREDYIGFLRAGVPLLEGLPDYIVMRIADEVEKEIHHDGAVILRQGSRRSNTLALRFLLDGKAAVSQVLKPGDAPVEVWRLRSGEHFGDVALVSEDGAHTATVTAEGVVACLALPERAFRTLLFPYVRARLHEALATYAYASNAAVVDATGTKHNHMHQRSIEDKEKQDQRSLSVSSAADACVARDDSITASSSVGSGDAAAMMAKVTAMRSAKLDAASFRLLGDLGQGANGRVRVARYERTGELFAVKVMDKTHIEGYDNGMEHLRAEKALTMSLAHPFLVNVYGSFQDRDRVYIVMEIVEGGTLQDAIRAHLSATGGKAVGGLNEDAARLLAAELVLGLQYIHGQHMVHRDLKPANVLLAVTHDEHGNVTGQHAKIADFGYAKRVWGDDRAWSLCGTTEYIAPEVLQNRGHGYAADIWSLGVIVYQMLTGMPPFHDMPLRRHNVIFEKVLSEPLTFPPHVRSNARNFVSQLLERDVSKRLGNGEGSFAEIRGHPWFRKINWDRLARQEYRIQCLPAGDARIGKAHDQLNTSGEGVHPAAAGANSRQQRQSLHADGGSRIGTEQSDSGDMHRAADNFGDWDY